MTARPDSGVRRVGIVPVALAALATAPVSAQAWRPLVEDLGDPTRSEAAERELIALGPGALPALQAVIEDANLGDQRERARFVAAMRVIDLLGSQVSDVQKSLGAPFLAPNGGNIRRGNIAYPLVEVLQALGSTTPYAGDIQFHNLFHLSVVWSNGKDKAATMRLIYRYQIRHDCKVGSAARAREVLAADRLFEREVAAEFLGVAGQPEDAALLRDRLLRRTPAAEGTAALRHNGFPVTCDDDFAFRAARALTRLAPDDKVSAIGYALLAVHHPHRSSRLEALQQLARFGPAIENAIPELMTVARGDDAELAAEALKLVGMGGRAAGGQLAAVDALTAHADPRVQRRAVTLAKMLRAMGHEAAEIDPAADAAAGARRELAAAVAALADGDADSDDVAAAERAIAAEP
ncbi:MAG: hypothetical protein KDE27_15865, partial [Planctomycetes bacterium]|nr:hypothetical protein [Planctomycetota bacterium]